MLSVIHLPNQEREKS